MSANAESLFKDNFEIIKFLTERDKVISKNIANADTPKYKPSELKMRGKSGISLAMSRTNSGHIDFSNSSNFDLRPAQIREIKPNGNAVNLDDELFKKSENAVRLQEAMGIYNKSRGMYRTAIKGNK